MKRNPPVFVISKIPPIQILCAGEEGLGDTIKKKLECNICITGPATVSAENQQLFPHLSGQLGQIRIGAASRAHGRHQQEIVMFTIRRPTGKKFSND